MAEYNPVGVMMTLPQNSRFDLTSGLPICRILNGMWQVSGAHGAIDPDAAIPSMCDYVDAGFTTWDLADHYGPAEDFVGEFRRRLASARGGEAVSGIQAFTKWVPRPGPMTRQVVENNIDISRRRMGMDRLDLLQFHWWDYRESAYLEALTHLSDLRDEGKIQELALTNFDTRRMQEIAGEGIRVVSNQVQYSLVDRRPEVAMVGFCQSHEVSLLAYGTLCGGLLSDLYLGRPEPTTAVLVRYVLDRPAVAGVIIGARLGVAEHINENVRVFRIQLDAKDVEAIERVLGQSRDLYRMIGDCGDEYRRQEWFKGKDSQ